MKTERITRKKNKEICDCAYQQTNLRLRQKVQRTKYEQTAIIEDGQDPSSSPKNKEYKFLVVNQKNTKKKGTEHKTHNKKKKTTRKRKL